MHSSACRLCCSQPSEVWRLWTSWPGTRGARCPFIIHPVVDAGGQSQHSSCRRWVLSAPQMQHVTFDRGSVAWRRRMWAGSKMMVRSRKTRRTRWPAWYPWDQWKGTSQGSKVKIISTVTSTFPWEPCRGRGPEKKKRKIFTPRKVWVVYRLEASLYSWLHHHCTL